MGLQMAHFAEVAADGTVVRVVVVNNADAPTEEAGAAYARTLLGGYWKQTSYNGALRKRFAGVGYTYDKNLDAFIPPKPFPSWVFDTGTASWLPPKPPVADKPVWDEASQSWM
jgi:hypothetical protein